MKTAEEIAEWFYQVRMNAGYTAEDAGGVRAMVKAAIEADRAQRSPEIYIVQNDLGDVIDVFRDEWEAREAFPVPSDSHSIIQETVWEPGEYARAVGDIR